MRIDVLFGVQQLAAPDVQGRVVAVIDVLRASTTIAAALANGARAVIPLESSEDVATRSKQFERSAALQQRWMDLVATASDAILTWDLDGRLLSPEERESWKAKAESENDAFPTHPPRPTGHGD